MKKFLAALLCLVMLFCTGCSRLVMLPEQNDELQPEYTQACDLLKAGDYEQAYMLFKSLGDYKDSALHASRFAYLPVKIVQEDDGMLEKVCLYTTDYTYNEYGECIERVGAYEDEAGPGFSEKSYYDDSGKLIKRESVSEAGFSTETYEYDTNDNLIKKVGCTEGADVGGIMTYTYNEQNLRQASEYSSYFGIDADSYESQEPYHTDLTEYYYDANNRCNKMIQHYGEDYLYTYTVEYNDNSLPLKIVTDDGQGTVLSTRLAYDDKGRCTEITTSYDTTVYSYGDGELPVSAIKTRDGGEPCDISYSYKLFYLRSEKDPMPFHVREQLYFLEW